MRRYVAVVHRKPGGYRISFPDLPGCTSSGATVDEAMRAARKALDLHLAGRRKAGEAAPAPRDFAAVIVGTDSKGALAFVMI